MTSEALPAAPAANRTLVFADEEAADRTHDYQTEELNLYYAICEVLVAALAVVGNALVILVFRKERRLRRRTNYYIVSLAAADFLVGLLGIPFAIMASVGLPTNLYACLFTVSLLVVLCTISIFCLVAVSVDRYWAILHPMGYSRNVRTKTALVIIGICWFAGTLIGFLPLMGWHKGPAENGRCFFLGVMDYNYLVFLYFGTIITPALLLAVFYAHIYHVVLRQLRQIVTINPYGGSSRAAAAAARSAGGGTMLRMLGAAQKREVKATQNLSIIVLFFMICWIPLYTINCILAFCRDCKVNSTFVLSCIILSHLNSAGNPLLYAYHLKDFRAALKAFICGIFGVRLQATSAPAPPNQRHLARRRLQSLREAHSALSLSRVGRYAREAQLRAHTLPLPAEAANGDFWRIAELSDEQRRPSASSSAADGEDEAFLPLGTRAPPTPPPAPQVYLIERAAAEHHSMPPRHEKPESAEARNGNLTITGDFIHSPAKSLKLSPFKAVGGLLRSSNGSRPPPPSRSCSLSEEGEAVRHRNNGYIAENHSCT